MPRLVPPPLAGYPVSYETRILFSDLDAQRHVNNVAFARWFEEGRATFDSKVFEGRVGGETGLALVLGRQVLNYLSSLLYPGMVTVATGVLRVGSASFTLGQGVFSDGVCYALGESTMVKVAAGESVALSDDERADLNTFLLPQDEAA